MNKYYKFYTVRHMETGTEYTFEAWTAYEAMQKMLYTLNLSKRDPNATINKTESGLHLYLEHSGNIYAVRNN